MFYAVVTFGSPRADIPAFRRDLGKAIADARAAIGTGSCSAARVYACETVGLARTADISEVRPGEQIAWA